jgi:hypothetical protein
MQDYERPTREERYQAVALFFQFTAARFQTPRISKAAAARLKEALNNAPALVLNQRHEAVKVLQQALIDLRDWRVQIPEGATGVYGPSTEDAVRAFQRSYGLVSRDGKAGNETLGRLDKLYAVPDPPPDEDVLYCPGAAGIPRIKQPDGASCWATAATMMYFWKHNPTDVPGTIPDTRIRYVLDHTLQQKEKWLETYTSQQGLASADNVPLLRDALRMQLVSSRPDRDHFHNTGFWTSHLRRSPLAVNTLRAPAGGGAHRNHFLVVYGIKPFGQGGSVLLCIDPATGVDRELSLSFVATLLGWSPNAQEDNQFRDRVFSW